MKRPFLALACALLAHASTAAILPYGAGSISDTINPAGYGCVVDHGYWIHSAGVVQPGIGGCDPNGDPNGVPYGSPVKIYPQLVGPAASVPTATHRWWGMVPFYGEGQVGGSGAGYLTADPLMARVSNRGIRVLSIPNGLKVTTANQFLYPIPAPANEVFDGIAIGNTQYANLNAYMKDHSDGSITVEWRSGSTPVMEATLVHGSPYLFFEVHAGTAAIRTKAAAGAEKGVFHETANTLGVWTYVADVRNHYLIVGDGTTQFTNPSAAETTLTTSSRRFTLVWLPVSGTASPSAAMIADFTQRALNRIARVHIDYAVDPATQAVTVSHDYLDAGGNPVDTLIGLMPMQWKNSAQPLTAYKTRSARGMVRFAAASGFDYRLQSVGVLPMLPTSVAQGLDETRLRSLVTEFVAAGPATWRRRADTYWSGKDYGKVAELAAIARDIGMTTEADRLLQWLRAQLEDWFTANNTGPLDTTQYFAYDSDWSTLLGMDESFGSHQQLNDHHFHYGYFVRAAAEICRVDPAWCGPTAYGPMVELLIRDYAAGRDDPMFPYLRHFDPANGFSWASGHANFALGNNNESTSEAANAYGAIILYGLITGNQALVDRGVYLHASTTSAYWEYWNNLDGYNGLGDDFDNFPAAYDRITTSILWGAGGVFSTWFSPAFAHILGIQGLPLNPLVLHIGQHPVYLQDYITLGLAESANGQPSGLAVGQWSDVWWNIVAMADAPRALADYATLDGAYQVEEGETKAHTYHWMHVFNGLGQVASGDGSLTADYPAAVAFHKNGVFTYLAYNLGDSTRRVRFSDGMAVNVPARSLGIKRTGDQPDPPPEGGDTQAPTTPGVLQVSGITDAGATLSWAASTDDVGVIGYQVSIGSSTLSTASAGLVVDGLSPETSYSVSVRAYDAAGNLSAARSGSFTTLAPSCAPPCGSTLPAGWTAQDVGSPLPGSSSFGDGVFTTQANGSDIWGTQDSFHFVHQTLTGDGQVTARVTSLQATDPWAKAGVMMRATLGANSANAFTAVTAANGTAFQRRTSAGASSSHTGGPAGTAPHWVRLVRSGNLFSGYVSSNGSQWTLVGTQSIAMPATVYVGLAHTSHRSGVLGLATFAQVDVRAGAVADDQPPTAPGAAVATQITASGARLDWAASTDDVAVAGYDVTVGGETLRTTATSLDVTGLAADTAYTVTVQAFDAAGNRSASSTASFSTLPAGCTTDCEAVNLALGRPATQSSTGYGGDAGKAVDGNTDGRYANGSVTHTYGSTQPWWQVDLGQASVITSVNVFNRTDCCASRLSNFYVFVSDASMSGRSLAQLVADPAVARVRVDSLGGAASITLPLAAQGRYVKVQHADTGGSYLSLAEVQVLGTAGAPPPASNLALGRPATQSSTGFGGDAGKAVDGSTDGRYANGSVTHTLRDTQAWWQVDLGEVRSLESVRVVNRTDCCAARLSNFHVFVSAADMSGRSVAQLTADPAVTMVLVASLNGLPDISLPMLAQGRFVKVQLAGSDYLSLAEVQVFGR
jgi:endoglucanase Acf2/chitodextrinase